MDSYVLPRYLFVAVYGSLLHTVYCSPYEHAVTPFVGSRGYATVHLRTYLCVGCTHALICAFTATHLDQFALPTLRLIPLHRTRIWFWTFFGFALDVSQFPFYYRFIYTVRYAYAFVPVRGFTVYTAACTFLRFAFLRLCLRLLYTFLHNSFRITCRSTPILPHFPVTFTTRSPRFAFTRYTPLRTHILVTFHLPFTFYLFTLHLLPCFYGYSYITHLRTTLRTY